MFGRVPKNGTQHGALTLIVRDLGSQFVAFRSGHFRNFGRFKCKSRTEDAFFLHDGVLVSTTMPSAPLRREGLQGITRVSF